MNDFGVSFSTSPQISTSYFGVRNAKVVFNNNSYKFQPFTTQRYPQENKLRKITTLSPPPRLRGPEGDNLTLNKFIKNFDSKPSISVDLEDFQKFPTFGMYEDIQDVVKNVCWRKTNSSTWITYTNAWFTTTSTKCNYTICRKISTNKCMARKQSRIVFSQCF